MWTSRALEREGYAIADAGDADVPLGILAESGNGIAVWRCCESATGLTLGTFPSLQALMAYLRG